MGINLAKVYFNNTIHISPNRF